jgi:hypothetical protein
MAFSNFFENPTDDRAAAWKEALPTLNADHTAAGYSFDRFLDRFGSRDWCRRICNETLRFHLQGSVLRFTAGPEIPGETGSDERYSFPFTDCLDAAAPTGEEQPAGGESTPL